MQVGKSYASAKEAIIMTGNFVLEHLQKMDIAAGGKTTFVYGATGFVNALKTEVRSRCRYIQTFELADNSCMTALFWPVIPLAFA